MILVVGSINVDVVFEVHGIPSTGQTILAHNKTTNPGGKGANQAVAASKLGADVVLLGCVGTDGNGTALLESLNNAGVNTDYVLRTDKVHTASAYICVSEAGENAIVVDSCANYLVTPEYLLAHEHLFKQADYCILQMEIPEDAVKKAIVLSHLNSVKVILNPSPLENFDMSILDGVEYIIANKDEATTLIDMPNVPEISADSWVHFMRCHGIRNLIITQGEKGAHHYSASGNDAFYPSQPQHTVDTTGAGDTFLGAFTHAIASNYTVDSAIKFANAAAGITVTRKGAQKSFPNKEELNEYLLNTKPIN